MFKFIFLIFFVYQHHLISGQQCPGVNQYNVGQQTDTSTCFIWGNYNLKTFDDHGLNFESSCGFTACNFLVGNRHFKIDFGGEDRRDCAKKKSGCFTFIKFLYNDVNYHLFLDDGKNPALTADGNPVPIPMEKNKLRVHRPGSRVIVEFLELGVEIRWDTKFLIQIKIENDRNYDVQGLCGNNNKCSTDDMMLTNKQIARTTDAFVKQYLVDPQACADVTLNSPCKSRIREHRARIACHVIRDNRFRDANALINPELYYQACVWNYCSLAILEQNERMCDALDAYAKAAVEAGLTKIISWRRPELCSKDATCGPSLDFYPCRPQTGGLQCGEANPVGYTKCEEGCYCGSNLFHFKGGCFLKKQCPCSFNNTDYKPGQSFPQKCNTCTCVNSHIECTMKTCFSVPLAFGQ